jgi:hypothetical protein
MLIQSNIVTKAQGSGGNAMTGNVVGAFLSTPQPNYGKLEMASAVTANSYDAASPTYTAPSSTGQTLLVYSPSTEEPNLLKLTPYSALNNAASPMVRVVGWHSYPSSVTNLVAFSQTFATSGATGTNTNWVDSNITRGGLTVTDPLGGTTALQITASAANGSITNAVASPALQSGNRAFSIFMRRVAGTGNIQVTMDGSTWNTQAITSSWVRYTFNATSVTSIGVRIATATTDTIEIWGAQVEAGTGSTTYVPTTTSSATISQTLYVPTVLAELTLAYNGTAGSIPQADFDGARRFFFSSVAASSGVPTVNTYSPGTAAAAGTGPGFAMIDTVGSQFVTIQFKSSTTTNNICGAFWSVI